MRFFESNEEMIAALRGRLKVTELPEVAKEPVIDPVVETVEETATEIEEEVNYEEMTKAELFAIAEEKGLTLPKKATKGEIIEAIEGEA